LNSIVFTLAFSFSAKNFTLAKDTFSVPAITYLSLLTNCAYPVLLSFSTFQFTEIVHNEIKLNVPKEVVETVGVTAFHSLSSTTTSATALILNANTFGNTVVSHFFKVNVNSNSGFFHFPISISLSNSIVFAFIDVEL
jgi:hypothetical protein